MTEPKTETRCPYGASIIQPDVLMLARDADLRRLAKFLKVRGASKMRRAVVENFVFAKTCI